VRKKRQKPKSRPAYWVGLGTGTPKDRDEVHNFFYRGDVSREKKKRN
jgi:hypothetical protein